MSKANSTRKTILMCEDVANQFNKLVQHHESWEYRANTIAQAAILAFADMPDNQQKEYLRKIRRKDGRWR